MPPQVLNHPDARHLLRRVSVCPIPTDVSSNASYSFSYTNGRLTTISVTIDGTTYSRTLSYTNGLLTSVTTWS